VAGAAAVAVSVPATGGVFVRAVSFRPQAVITSVALTVIVTARSGRQVVKRRVGCSIPRTPLW
jgi:hypothetical protein